MFKRTRRVRLHLKPGLGPGSVEGFMQGRCPVAGAYVLTQPRVIVSESDSYTLDVLALEVPAENVVMREVLAA